MTKAQIQKIKELTPLIKAIRDRCLGCSANSSYEVKMCVCPNCPLYPYRMGLNSQEADLTRENSLKGVRNTITEPISEEVNNSEARE